MKLVIDLVNGLHQAALAEGLHLAKKTSVDPYRLLEILDPGTAYSKGLGAKGLRMIEEDFEPQIRLSQQLKAAQLILDVAKGVETELPLSETYRTLLQTADAQGNGHLDDSAIIQAWNTVRSSTDQTSESMMTNDS